jgi:hypothetical protein
MIPCDFDDAIDLRKAEIRLERRETARLRWRAENWQAFSRPVKIIAAGVSVSAALDLALKVTGYY